MKGVVFPGERKLEIGSSRIPRPARAKSCSRSRRRACAGATSSSIAPSADRRRSASGKRADRPSPATSRAVSSSRSEVTLPRSKRRSGMRAMQHHYRGCGVCEHCSTGWMQLCVEGVKEVYGVTGHGAHASYMKCPARTLVRCPTRSRSIRAPLSRAARARPGARCIGSGCRAITRSRCSAKACRPVRDAARRRDGCSRYRARYERRAAGAREGVRR